MTPEDRRSAADALLRWLEDQDFGAMEAVDVMAVAISSLIMVMAERVKRTPESGVKAVAVTLAGIVAEMKGKQT